MLEIYLHKEEGWGWIKGEAEKKLPDILPIYDEIKRKNYKFLSLISAVNDELTGEKENALNAFMKKKLLSSAQKAFLVITGIGHGNKN